MDIRQLTPAYAVAPQIAPEDMPAIRAAGFTRVINNRPDGEISPDLHAEVMRQAALAAGLEWAVNPVPGAGIGEAEIARHRAALQGAKGPVLAYCRSGTRSTIVWALAEAGRQPVEALIEAGARGGYDLTPYRERLNALASG